ncbi:hypothetical protein NPIL_636021 [Nephila pilipes]|uniref:Uncharacterized protein n=1 Tax=Nephila pilipes TaxID=299642 RepID=A0A8X6TWN3_NEPPI|nr:hypothetical protein NPIL_636021 [Nephila pilipes]
MIYKIGFTKDQDKPKNGDYKRSHNLQDRRSQVEVSVRLKVHQIKMGANRSLHHRTPPQHNQEQEKEIRLRRAEQMTGPDMERIQRAQVRGSSQRSRPLN